MILKNLFEFYTNPHKILDTLHFFLLGLPKYMQFQLTYTNTKRKKIDMK